MTIQIRYSGVAWISCPLSHCWTVWWTIGLDFRFGIYNNQLQSVIKFTWRRPRFIKSNIKVSESPSFVFKICLFSLTFLSWLQIVLKATLAPWRLDRVELGGVRGYCCCIPSDTFQTRWAETELSYQIHERKPKLFYSVCESTCLPHGQETVYYKVWVRKLSITSPPIMDIFRWEIISYQSFSALFVHTGSKINICTSFDYERTQHQSTKWWAQRILPLDLG